MEQIIEPVKISDAEWEVMRVVWTQGTTDAATISEALSQSKGWKLSTIKTLLGRLVKKDVLATEQIGKKYLYSPKVTEEQTVESATENLFSHICAKKVGATIVDLIDEATLSAEDIQAIKQAVSQKEPVKNIECNCIPGQCHCKEHQKMEA